MRIGINCGHTVSGQPGCGAVGYIDESVEVRKVGRSLMELLRRTGHTVYDCTNDYAVTTNENLQKIVALANAQPLDLFVSIHFNSGGGHGTEVFTYGGKSLPEAENACKQIAALGFTNRGIKDGSNLYVVRRSDAKAMLIEVCFVDSKTDTEHYKELGPDIIAQAICKGITGENTEESEELTVGRYRELKKEIDSLKPMIYDYIDDNMPAWARPVIQSLKTKGVLVGDENGKLGLTDDMLRIFVILDRQGIFD